MPVGATAKAVKSVSGGEGEAGAKLTADPAIGSRWPDAALNPSTCPENLRKKNHPGVGGGGGLIENLPPLQATASAATDVAASAANFDLTEGFRTTSGVVSCFNPDVFGSQRMVHPFCFAPKPALDLQIRLSIGLTTQIQCCLILCDADHFTVCFHYPASHDVPQSPSNDSPQNIRHIVVSHINSRNTHAEDAWKEYPEEPPPVPPRSPKCGNRPRDVLRGKRGAVYPPVFLNQVAEPSERSARKIAVPHARKRKPRALHREEYRDDVAEHVSDG